MNEKKASPPRHDPKVVKALRNFAISISVFNILGYTLFGFEQPWLYPFIALATAYTVEFGLEIVGARVEGRVPRFLGGGARGVLEFLYPATITALALNMLIYVNDRVWVMMFGVVVAVGGKWVLRAPVRGRMRHFMNPSNLGIAVILLLFPWAAIAPPYEFTEHLSGLADWIVPAVILVAGTILNAKLTGRVWLIAGWLGVFVLQAIVRGLVLDTAILGALATMTGVAFVLFTNYMITDPGTSPSKPASQVAFGGGIALLYGFFAGAGITYGLFFATALGCLIRGGFLWSMHFAERTAAGAARESAVSADGSAAPASDPADGRKVVPA
ncbi:RnfABCDGE type electron transport complex subunit D [Actinomadura alba]|uniref:RnfABCDGE type electron transport complex subunit D n=1 Tax=Actinomadura alba TaxID=406431 RepID=A0ABR7LRD4_9ACTN|nr:RnfABCDGE type electron transport complex subunit D [Actinomadura alba]MBC6467407.1 RnfABCDGE type electron transport complex subunit D [Actinomadura alba]